MFNKSTIIMVYCVMCNKKVMLVSENIKRGIVAVYCKNCKKELVNDGVLVNNEIKSKK